MVKSRSRPSRSDATQLRRPTFWSRGPLCTCRTWIRRGIGDVVTVDAPIEGEAQLRERIVKVEPRVARLAAVVGLVLALLRVSGFKLELSRVPDAQKKRLLLGAIERARRTMPLARALRVIGLSASRYHDWVGSPTSCSLGDRSSCPRSKPQRLTESLGVIRDRHSHMRELPGAEAVS